MMSLRTATLAVLSATLASTVTAEWTCKLPFEEPYGPDDKCPEMNAYCYFDNQCTQSYQRYQCRCGKAGDPWVCSCRGDSFATITNDSNSTDVESLEISGSVSASAVSAVVMGGMAAVALL